MATLQPKFDFSPNTPAPGDGQSHTDGRVRQNALRPEYFNEIERVMADICDVVGDYSLSDTIIGAPNNLGGAIRYGYLVHKTDIESLYDIKYDKAGGTITGDVLIQGITESTSKDTGALILEGGLGVEKNLYIGISAHVLGTTDSSSKDTGALIVDGGIGIEKTMYVGVDAHILQNLTIYGTTNSTSKDTGSLILEGGVGIEKDLYVGVDAYILQDITISRQVKSLVAIGTSPLTVVSDTVVTNLNADKIDGLHWYEVLPIGTILMFDGGAWTDNVTMPNWYACIAANAGEGCPDMVDSFVMGSIFGNIGVTGGANARTLITANLPVHSHTINHNHPIESVVVAENSVSHSHPVSIGSGGAPGASMAYWGYTYNTTFNSGSNNTPHIHAATVNISDWGGTSGNTGSGTAFDNRPAFYSMLLIRRCY